MKLSEFLKELSRHPYYVQVDFTAAIKKAKELEKLETATAEATKRAEDAEGAATWLAMANTPSLVMTWREYLDDAYVAAKVNRDAGLAEFQPQTTKEATQ